MEGIDLKSMPLDELWALHETICSILARKLEAEKRSLEQRLNKLRRTIGNAFNETRHGPVVADSPVGCANCLRPAKPSTICGFYGRRIGAVPPADE